MLFEMIGYTFFELQAAVCHRLGGGGLEVPTESLL